MNINHLAIFYAVYCEQSVSLGADKLHISQPAVSKQLKLLEENLKTHLFDRHAKGVRPTEAGVILADYARRLFALEAEAEQALSELNGLKRGRLNIGASLTIGNYLLPDLLAIFHERYPGVEVTVDIANTERIQQRLIGGELVFGLTEGYVESDDLDCDVFGEDELVPVASPRHPIMSLGTVTLEQICKEDFVVREAGSGTREVMKRTLAERGLAPKVVMSLGDIEAVKRAVAAGIGIGLLSAYAISTEIGLGWIVRIPVDGFVLKRPLHLLLLRDKYLSVAARAMLPLIHAGHDTIVPCTL